MIIYALGYYITPMMISTSLIASLRSFMRLFRELIWRQRRIFGENKKLGLSGFGHFPAYANDAWDGWLQASRFRRRFTVYRCLLARGALHFCREVVSRHTIYHWGSTLYAFTRLYIARFPAAHASSCPQHEDDAFVHRATTVVPTHAYYHHIA